MCLFVYLLSLLNLQTKHAITSVSAMFEDFKHKINKLDELYSVDVT